MKIYKKIIFSFILFLLPFNIYAEVPHYLDFKYILNESIAGKKAQESLKKKLNDGVAALNKKEKNFLEEEKKIIQQKKLISSEEYKNKISELRKKAANLQKERNKLVNDVSKQRSKAKNELLKNLNPIIKEYMISKNIKMVIDRKNLILADKELDITKDIVNLLNKKLKEVKLN